MTDTNARAALAARRKRIDAIPAPLPSVAWGNSGAPLPSIAFRTVAEVREHEGRKSITRRLGR